MSHLIEFNLKNGKLRRRSRMRLPRRKMRHEETQMQMMFVLWLESKGILFNASMAGVNLGRRSAVIRKRMGARSGFPDIQILEPTDKYSGLFLELKSKAGKQDREGKQVWWQTELNRRGYCALIMPTGLDIVAGLEWCKGKVEAYLNESC